MTRYFEGTQSTYAGVAGFCDGLWVRKADQILQIASEHPLLYLARLSQTAAQTLKRFGDRVPRFATLRVMKRFRPRDSPQYVVQQTRSLVVRVVAKLHAVLQACDSNISDEPIQVRVGGPTRYAPIPRQRVAFARIRTWNRHLVEESRVLQCRNQVW